MRRIRSLSARAASSAELDRRNAMLRFKQELIGQAVADADAALNNAPPEAYFAALAALYRRYAQKGDAVLRLNARDLARLPEGFLETLQEANPEGNVTLGEEPADIDGGFLLSFGGVDVNCSFSALIEAGESTLRDLCAKRLFAPED